MSDFTRRPVVAAILPFALLWSAPAWADDAAEAGAAAAQADETTSADADTSDSSDAIIVTARRRSEGLQDIPIAVTVVSGEQIDNTGAFNVGRLQQLTPTLQFYSSNPRNTSVNIRGLGSPFGLTNDGIEQGVGIYVDDVYYSRVASATFDFLDVARIETLRGPQGTLYGKNTTAGAINITTRQPTFDFEARAEVTVGNLEFKQAKAAISGPITDTLAARLAVSATSRRGTIFNVTSDRYINEQDNLGARFQLLFQPSDSFEVTLAADYNRQRPECCAQIFVRTGATQRPLNRQYAALTAAQNYAVPSTNPFDRLTDVDASLNAGNEIGGVALRANWEVGPGTLTSVTAYRYWDWLPENDRDFTGLPITTESNNPSQQKQYTQEIRYSVDGDRFDYVVGAFAYRQTIRTQGLQVQGSAASRWLLNPTNALANDPTVLDGLTANNDIRLDNDSLALFGQLTWNISDAFSIQPGIRINYDSKEGLYDSVVTNGAGQLVTFASTDPRIVAQRGVLAPQRFDATFSDWNLSYDLTASYEISDDVRVYATYARSFKSGGVNLNGVPADASGAPILSAATVRPEEVDHFEVGLKTQFADRRVTFNLTGFWTDVSDYQAVVTNGQLGVLRGYLANADAVRVRGFELDSAWRVSDRFNLYARGAWTDAEYKSFVDAPCPPELSGGTTVGAGQTPGAPGTPGSLSPANCDISGQDLPGVSKWSLSWGGEYNIPIALFGGDGFAYAGYDGSYRSSFSSNPTPSIYTGVDGYSLHNFRLGFRSDSGWDIYAFARNAFDEEYFEQLAVPSGNTGLIVGQPGDPATYGVTIKIEI
ncbi:MAG: TonB-dependent receptor [Sphingopyxis sp.]|nr:TonB-dependent receptor [Sphingopyxis sp.]